jgi:glycine cleavage system H protein
MEQAEHAMVDGFPLALDRCYQAETHMWVLVTEPGRVRIGMDSVGIETSGTLAQLSIVPTGTELAAGRPFGQLEAAKFVGPLVSPVSGVVLELNGAAVADAGLVERDPYGAGWLIEVRLGEADDGLTGLLADPTEITAWFAAKIARYRLDGVIAL